MNITYFTFTQINGTKPQGVKLKIIISKMRNNSSNNNFTIFSKQVSPEQELGEATYRIHSNEETSDTIANDLCILEDKEGLLSSKILEDTRV